MKSYKRSLLFIVIMLFTFKISAQAPPPPPPPGLAIDGGLILLFLAAIGYGYKKIK